LIGLILTLSLILYLSSKSHTTPNSTEPQKRSSELRGPLVINTWAFTKATDLAYQVLTAQNPPDSNSVHLDALESGLHYCEDDERCGWAVGAGGSPDETGETTLDAAFVDGDTLVAGAVGCLRRVSNAIGVARAITKYTKHTLLVGDLATEFALEMGFQERDLHTNYSISRWKDWKANRCQPNYRKNVIPDPSTSCGPYQPTDSNQQLKSKILFKDSTETQRPIINQNQHDTFGMVVLTASGSIAAGATTNGATWKVPGRAGDVPIIGSGSYADSRLGGCAATGDGDLMMKFLPCFLVLENLRNGFSLQVAADRAILRIFEFYTNFAAALVVLSPSGEFAGSAYGWGGIPEMTVRNSTMDKSTVYRIEQIIPLENGNYKPSKLVIKE